MLAKLNGKPIPERMATYYGRRLMQQEVPKEVVELVVGHVPTLTEAMAEAGVKTNKIAGFVNLEEFAKAIEDKQFDPQIFFGVLIDAVMSPDHNTQLKAVKLFWAVYTDILKLNSQIVKARKSHVDENGDVVSVEAVRNLSHTLKPFAESIKNVPILKAQGQAALPPGESSTALPGDIHAATGSTRSKPSFPG